MNTPMHHTYICGPPKDICDINEEMPFFRYNINSKIKRMRSKPITLVEQFALNGHETAIHDPAYFSNDAYANALLLHGNSITKNENKSQIISNATNTNCVIGIYNHVTEFNILSCSILY